ncbi:MAG: ABC transporter permease subunit [Chromatiales bacterium]|jgi:ABC-2 type transport system permease protein|nr:ABC transporter permease subunit [Chromatiales bacterium]MDX9766693.1 ABC transporter permease subunit [Ectothiorhodospiraceae bacterium]
MILTIAGNELRRMFYSPLAWAILAVVLFILALLFLVFIENFLTQVQPRFAGMDGAPGVTDSVVAPLLLWAGVLMLGIMPLITMRLFSEEKARGTLPLLLSSPVSMTQIVLGKYLGVLGFVAVMLGLIVLMPLSIAPATSLDWGKFASGLLGLVLLLASFAAAGLYLSTLSAQPAVAAVSSFGLLIFLVILYVSGSSPGSASELFVYLSHFGHFLSFLEGLFNSADLAYYLLFIATFLTLAVRRLDNERLQR